MLKKTRHVYFPDEDASEAQKWLCRVLNMCGMTQSEIADKLHTTRQSINKLVNGNTELTFDKICAICWACDLGENPDKIYHELYTTGGPKEEAPIDALPL